MTTDTQEVSEELTPEQQAEQDRQDEEAFSKAFDRMSGKTPPDEAKSEEKAETSAPASQEEPKTEKSAVTESPKAEELVDVNALAARIAALESIPSQVQKLSGHVGVALDQIRGLTTKATKAAEAAGAESPTDKQVQAALANPEAWKQLREDFPEWAGPVEAELTALRKEIGKRQAPQVDTAAIERRTAEAVDEAEERAFVRLKHPTWKKDVKTPEFQKWFSSQANEVKALAGSKMADDAIRLLDSFKEHQTKATETKQKNERRLERAVAPKGGTPPASTAISDDEAFTRGFKRALGR